MKKTRRKFLKNSGLAAGAGMVWLYGCANTPPPQAAPEEVAETAKKMFFDISLAQWSLHRTIRDRKELDNLDFAMTAKKKYGIGAVEYVSQFFQDKAADEAYLAEMKKRADEHGVKSLLIMVDSEGGLAETDKKLREKAVNNHHKWVGAAVALGCHSIRVNAYSSNPDRAEAAKAGVEGLSALAEYAKANGGINVIVENHGGFSSDGKWLSGIMAGVNLPNCGTLPDFGNFCVVNGPDGKCAEEYDRYLGVKQLMPYAQGVSAKSHDFDAEGNEASTDYRKMLQIVKDAGYKGYIGVEYEGNKLSEEEGIKKTKALLEKVGMELS